MPISFTCPHCGNSMNVADQYGGQSGPCAKCGQTIQIPFGTGFVATPPTQTKTKSGGATLLVILAIVGGGVLLCGVLGIALLLPAVQAAREAARRTQCSNNLRQITIALHNYHDVWGSLPPAYTVDANGKPLHSWRTLILPYLEQSPLYDQIDLNQPWDSPRNAAFATQMPRTYGCPSDPQTGPGSSLTNYLAVVGPGTAMEGDKPVKFGQVIDGTSNTVLITEARGAGIHWMEPRDMDMNAFINAGQGPTTHPGGANIAMADGSVRFLSSSTPPQTRQALATRGGGEMVPGF